MKKVFALVFGLAMTIGFTQDANAWWWKSQTLTCTITETISVGFYEETATYPGTFSKCVDGSDWCLPQRCTK